MLSTKLRSELVAGLAWAVVWFAGAAAAVALVTRVGILGRLAPDLVQEWGWFGPRFDTRANAVLISGLTVLLIAVGSRWLRRPSEDEGKGGALASTALIGGVLGVAVAVAATIEVLVPTTPYAFAEPACDGAYLPGSDFYAVTPSGGVSARTGPGRGYPQVNRFGGQCTLGFEGYCVGDAVDNPVTDLPDSRWLIVNGGDTILVAAAILGVESQSKDAADDLADGCEDLGGLSAPTNIRFTVEESAPDLVSMTTEARSVPLVGYAQALIDPQSETYPFTAIGTRPDAPIFGGEWSAATDAGFLRAGNGTMVLLASACLSASNPVGDPAAYTAKFKNGHLRRLLPLDVDEASLDDKSEPLTAEEVDILAGTACYGTRK